MDDKEIAAPVGVPAGNPGHVKTRKSGEPWVYKDKAYAQIPRRPGIYFIGASKDPDVFKLGISLHTPLANRLQVTQVHNPYELHIALFVQVDDERLLRRLESRLQKE